MYDTREEAQQKLSGSTVLFDGLPVHVLDARGSKNKVQLDFHRLPLPSTGVSGPQDSVNINDPRWDFRTLGTKIGYVDVEKSPFDGKQEAVFVTRIPTRNSRQGLDHRTTRVWQFPLQEHSWNWEQLICFEGLVRSIQNKYVTTQQAVQHLYKYPDTVKSVAVGRKLLMTFDKINPPNLVYRHEKIGYSEDGVTFKLAPHKVHLKEELVDMQYLKIV